MLIQERVHNSHLSGQITGDMVLAILKCSIWYHTIYEPRKIIHFPKSGLFCAHRLAQLAHMIADECFFFFDQLSQ
jgi:hypothetical protein